MSDIFSLLTARYGENIPKTLFELNPTLETLLAHKTVRNYLSTPLPDGAVELLVSAAQSVASSSNLQLWSVVAITDAARKQRLAELANNQAHIAQAPLFLVWLADVTRLAEILTRENLSAEALYQLDLFLIAAIDTGLAAQNAVLAAEAQGWGTVYIGALRQNVQKVAAELQLPKGVFPVFGLCVGFQAESDTTEIKPRLAQSAVLHHETYQANYPETEIAQYNQLMRQFYDKQNMNVAGDWSSHCSDRIQNRKPHHLSNLYRDLRELGFLLTEEASPD